MSNLIAALPYRSMDPRGFKEKALIILPALLGAKAIMQKVQAEWSQKGSFSFSKHYFSLPLSTLHIIGRSYYIHEFFIRLTPLKNAKIIKKLPLLYLAYDADLLLSNINKHYHKIHKIEDKEKTKSEKIQNVLQIAVASLELIGFCCGIVFPNIYFFSNVSYVALVALDLAKTYLVPRLENMKFSSIRTLLNKITHIS